MQTRIGDGRDPPSWIWVALYSCRNPCTDSFLPYIPTKILMEEWHTIVNDADCAVMHVQIVTQICRSHQDDGKVTRAFIYVRTAQAGTKATLVLVTIRLGGHPAV